MLSIALAMDAFAVSVGKGLCLGKVSWRHMVTAGAWFGGFQAGMPVLGYLAGSLLASVVDRYDHWIAFILLVLIGANMIRETLCGEEKQEDGSLRAGEMLVLAIATSIDALAVGVSLALTGANIAVSAFTIGMICFAFSAVGIKAGSWLGERNRKAAQIIGGGILIFLGVRILVQGLMQ